MKSIWQFGLLLLGACVFIISPKLLNAAHCQADVVVRNAHIVTMDDARRIATSMAIRDGKIVAVGDAKSVGGCQGAATTVVDLHNQTVLPGLIDIHTHGIAWAETMVRNDIDAGYPKVRSIADIVKAVAERAAAAKPDEWTQGGGWDDSKLAEHRYLRREDLDSVSPNTPVYLQHVSGHIGVANSAALKVVGITGDTLDPPGGIIEKDAAGQPTGLLRDKAMDLLVSKLPLAPLELRTRAAKLVSDKALELGLTSIHDIWGGSGPLGPEDMQAYQQAYERGWVKIRVQMAPGVANVSEAERLARSGVHTGFGNDHLKLGAVKFFGDGGLSSITAALYPPAAEGLPEDNLGILIWKREDMQKAQRILAAAGWQLETHVQGDRGADAVLDSYAAVIKELNLSDHRFRIVHGGISTPAIQKRIRDLHVLVDSNPPFIYWLGSFFTRYGPERLRWIYPLRSYFDKGIVAGAGSDVPVTPLSPWWGVWAAVARRELTNGTVITPEERITVVQALEMYTRNGAYIGFEEKQKGSLESGKFADFIIIDRDILSIQPDQIKDVQVLKTYVGGELVYAKK